MTIDIKAFNRACNPKKTLNIANPEDQKLYIDFSTVRGGKIIEEMCDEITEWSEDEPTCQLFTGHIGCGKSTELLRLKSQLEEKDFYVVYFESQLEAGDVDISDILIAMTRQILEQLTETGDAPKLRGGFTVILENAKNLLNEVGVPFPGTDMGINIFKVFSELLAKLKDSPGLRSRLRAHLEPQTSSILKAMNQELLEPANEILKTNGKSGLVVIIDNLDRIQNTVKAHGSPQPKYLFVERGEQLKGLNCHVVYTIPLELIFSNDYKPMTERFGVRPYVLPMAPVQHRDGSENEGGMAALSQMVLVRAFPEQDKRPPGLVTEIFDSKETLNRLCRVSGGHIRGLIMLLHDCIRKEKRLPISRETLEDVILIHRNEMILPISDAEWELLRQVRRTRKLGGDEQFQQLLRSMFVFEYRDREGSWFDVNPIIAEAKELSS